MERPSFIRKTAVDLRLPPLWSDYEAERQAFSWDLARRGLQGLPQGGLNMGFEAVDRHAGSELRERCALRFVARNLPAIEMSYGELARQTNRFANVLQRLGVGKGGRMFVLAGRIPELYVAVLGALKNGTVVTPLFSAFGPEPINRFPVRDSARELDGPTIGSLLMWQTASLFVSCILAAPSGDISLMRPLSIFSL